MPKYKVLKPIGWRGDRQIVGTELTMEEKEAKSIGADYLKLVGEEATQEAEETKETTPEATEGEESPKEEKPKKFGRKKRKK